jgi:N6-L-threonylcarbamoyladenine synthase
MAAAFQTSVVDVLSEKTARAAKEYGVKAVLLSGGVSANEALRKAARARVPVPIYTVPNVYCTDNAAMIAAAGYYRFQAGERAGWDLDVEPSLRLV